MKIVKINDHVGVAGQIAPEHVASIAAAGYAVIVNNRPDGEVPHQPTSAAIAAAAKAAGLEYHYYPLNAVNYPGDDLPAMAALFDNPQRPVLAFCRSGTRSTNLWISTRDQAQVGAARAHADRLGFDVSMSAH